MPTNTDKIKLMSNTTTDVELNALVQIVEIEKKKKNIAKTENRGN